MKTAMPFDVKLEYGDEFVYLHPETDTALGWMLRYCTEQQVWQGRAMRVDRDEFSSALDRMRIAGLTVR